MSFSRADEESKAFFTSIVPEDPRVRIKPMFGNLAGFINGNMFTGLYGRQVFVRLGETERRRLLEQEGAAEFSPMPGKPMKEYVTLPEEWRQEPDKLRNRIELSLAWVGEMPEKAPSKKANSKKSR